MEIDQEYRKVLTVFLSKCLCPAETQLTDSGVRHSQLLRSRTLSIVRYSKKI
jgi:hypothetical protein